MRAMSFSVLTLNLWNANEPLAARFSALAAGLPRLRPDIVCLQEVGDDPRSGRRQSELVAQACDLAHALDKDALSILSRFPIVRSRSEALPEIDEPRQVLMAECIVDGRPLALANTHLVYIEGMGAERKAQARVALGAIKAFRANDGRQPAILCGDFNDVPDSPPVRLVTDSGFQDVHARCHPGSPGLTFTRQNSYVPSSYPEDRRLDYIFTTEDLQAEDCSVVFDGRNGLDLASDHYGVFCRLGVR
jgi:endonuclease/exonuclease/phosphatase family metal-dependent hydrolase